MPHDVNKPFPFPPDYHPEHHTLKEDSIRDYVEIFERRRQERPGGKFAAADIEQIMWLAEDLADVHKFEIHYLRSLLRDHPDYFRDAAQKTRLAQFADNHEIRRRASKQDDFVRDLLKAADLTVFREPTAPQLIETTQRLSSAVGTSEQFHQQNGTYDPDLVERVNVIAAEMEQFADGLTLGDIDKPGRKGRLARLRDLDNFVSRIGGKTDHEAKWLGDRWVNWNRDVTIYPKDYKDPDGMAAVVDLLEQDGPLRLVAGGHAFNISSSMGGRKGSPIGRLVTLDKYGLDGVAQKYVEKMNPNDARQRYNLSAEQADHVVRASAGMRLREFGKAAWELGLSLPVAGSTDAQSLGGLIATDLHSTGHTAGFLSQQLLEVTVLDAAGEVVRFVKDEDVPRGQLGRWTMHPPHGGAPRQLSWLPVSGALGTLGVVVEVVLQLVPAFRMKKHQLFVPRAWAEQNIEGLLDPRQADPLLAYNHVSFYYAGGGGNALPTVRMNTWKHTDEPVSKDAEQIKTLRELFDHIGSGFLPNYMLSLSKRKAPEPGKPPGDADDWLVRLNNRKALVLQSNEAFARKLFFQHDEVEVGIPLRDETGALNYDIFRRAISETQRLLKEQEFETIIEIRFTPDVSEAMLGPGTSGPTCYIELATPLGEFSKARIVQVYQLFEETMRSRFRARPHLGKKTSVEHADMARTYGSVWDDFQAIRRQLDPGDRFVPRENALLNRIFRP